MIGSYCIWFTYLGLTYLKLYGLVAKKDTKTSKISVDFVGAPTDRAATLRQPDSKLGTVVENRVLTADGAPVKRHIGTSVNGHHVIVPLANYPLRASTT